MKLSSVIILTILLGTTGGLITPSRIEPVNAWGWETHRAISDHSMALMPDEWQTFLAAYQIDLLDASVEPDSRKALRGEGPRHYDDSDIPHKNYNVSPDSDDYKLGVVSWAIENSTRDLTIALQERNLNDIILYMGDVAHYISDASQPFHSTGNHDGQLTNNFGIHARFEVDLVEIYTDQIYLFENVISPVFISDPFQYGETFISTGLAYVPSILSADDTAMAQTGGQVNDEYYAKMFELVGDLSRERVILGIKGVLNLWYTAFVNAGVISNDVSLGFLEMDNNTLIIENSLQTKYYFESRNVGDILELYLNDVLLLSTDQDSRYLLELTELLEGSNKVTLIVKDENNNTLQFKSYFVTVDTTPPKFTAKFTINSIGSGDYEVILHVYSNDNIKIIKGAVDGSGFNRWNNNTAQTFRSGSYLIEIKVEDIGGWKLIESFDIKVGSSDDDAPFYQFSLFVLILIPILRRKLK